MEHFDQSSFPSEVGSGKLHTRGDFNIKSPMMFLAMSKKAVISAWVYIKLENSNL